ncbi:hypothetical protein [Psychrobacter immobilis]|uniref:hypothetical protein n=1 Tax=Psychrobacter immobilis TaxID=498 RepID=UPI00191AA31C|nr:hypothetical protein [Psychrobacter immobilis]
MAAPNNFVFACQWQFYCADCAAKRDSTRWPLTAHSAQRQMNEIALAATITSD